MLYAFGFEQRYDAGNRAVIFMTDGFLLRFWAFWLLVGPPAGTSSACSSPAAPCKAVTTILATALGGEWLVLPG